MTTTYIPTSQAANAPDSIFWLEKASQPGRTTLQDIKGALDEYERNYHAGTISKAEMMTLHRAFPDSPTYAEAAGQLQKMDMVEPLVIGGPASVELIDREGHLITSGALDRAFQKFMDNERTRNVMVLHSDVQVGWALPAYISKGGQIYKSGVDDKGLFFICELRNDTSIAKKVADQINDGLLKSYSIAGSATKVQNMKKGMTPYMQVDEMELAEVTVCEKGVNQAANFEILKAELPQTGKVDKDQCGYRDATAPEMQMGISCGDCKYFNAEQKTCDVVVGDIQPGDYCKLFEASEEKEQPHGIVHRKIIIMRSEDNGKINFQKSFLNWMEKESDPLKGKSFATLENIAGREAEHHRLLQEYGFPSEPSLDSMRYIPVVETETDDDGKPIHIIPPWVVNEAGQDLGDKLDEDAPSFKKSIDIFDAIIKKATATKRIGKVPGDGTPVGQENPKQFTESLGVGPMPQVKPDPVTYGAKPESNMPGPVPVEPKPQGRDAAGIGQDYGPQPAKFSGERQFTPEPEKRPGLLQRLGSQFGGGREGTSPPAPSQGRDAEGLRRDYPPRSLRERGAETGRKVLAGGRQVMERGRDRMGSEVKRMGELFGAGARRAKAGAQEAKDIGVGIGRDVKETAGIARGKIAGGIEEGRQQAREFGAGLTGKQAGVRMREEGGPEGRRRRGGAAYRMGQRTRGAGKEIKEGTKAGARSVRDFGEGVGEGFTSVSGYEGPERSPIFDRERSGGFGPHGRPSSQRRSGSKRLGQLFGATGRGAAESSMQGAGLAAEGAFRGAREAGRFGRGVARGAAPGQAGRSWRGREQGDDAGSDRQRTASEKFGQWLGERGRERGADVLRESGRSARGFGRGVAPGEWGKRQRAEWDAEGGDRSRLETLGRGLGTATRGAGRWGANVPTEGGRKLPKFGSEARQARHMLEDEGVGKGMQFNPQQMSGDERHNHVRGKLDHIQEGGKLSPRDWMNVIHHLSQNEDGDRLAHFTDMNFNPDEWHKPVSMSEMRQHLDTKVRAHHGRHGGSGAQALRQIVDTLHNSNDNGHFIDLKRLQEQPAQRGLVGGEEASSPNAWEQAQTSSRPVGRTRRQARRRNARNRSAARQRRQAGNPEAPLEYSIENAMPVHKIFAKAFSLPVRS